MNVTDGRKEVTWKLKMCSWIYVPITLSLLQDLPDYLNYQWEDGMEVP